jgi:hypothetical protein
VFMGICVKCPRGVTLIKFTDIFLPLINRSVTVHCSPPEALITGEVLSRARGPFPLPVPGGLLCSALARELTGYDNPCPRSRVLLRPDIRLFISACVH